MSGIQIIRKNGCWVMKTSGGEEFGHYPFNPGQKGERGSWAVYQKAWADKEEILADIRLKLTEQRLKECRESTSSMDFLDRCMGILP